jgi:protein-L-isoaspartate(D-aspartate) O-methyltransferase
MANFNKTPSESRPAALHHALVDQLVQRGVINEPAVEAAFRAVPRHLFLPGVPLDQVYQDQPIPTKYAHGLSISSSSQPGMMAIMLEQLALAPGHRVLEIGAGTGYNAALIAHLVGPTGLVVTLDVDADLAANAVAHLATAGVGNVRVVHRDGAFGFPPLAPYDRILATVGTWDIVPAWQAQLAPRGRLVAPLALFPGLMLSVALEPVQNRLQSVSAVPCGFMPLRGAAAPPPDWEWAKPQITISPRAERQASTDCICVVEKPWNTVTVAWPVGVCGPGGQTP